LTSTIGVAAPRLRSEPRGRPLGFWAASFYRLLRNKLAMFALLGLVVLASLAFSAPLFEQALGLSRDEIDLANNYQRPSPQHWFGTDEYGRDYFIRMLYGGQVSMTMGLAVAGVILAIGVPLGLAAGYYGGLFDDVLNWVIQIMVTLPVLYVLIFVSALIPPAPIVLAFIIGAFGWMSNARQARGVTFQLKRAEYVTAARALGATDARILFRHILPNIISLMIILAGFDVVAGAIAETSLSFLGLGVRPPIPSWGNMLTNAFSYMFRAPYLVFFPVVAISLFVLFVYMLADGLRDAFDPGLKE
jgi:ABC-type dipeptide/oligopeptide/nickel transport system permease subunit